MIIYLLRHAQTDDNLIKRYTGSNDGVGINQEGREQLNKIVPFLKTKRIQVIFSSPFKRCEETALILKKKLKVNLLIDEKLREVNYGDWQGLTSEQVREKYPKMFQARGEDPVHVPPPEGETLLKMQQRVLKTIGEIIETKTTCLVVTHGSCIHAALMYYLGINLMKFWDFSQKHKLVNCAIWSLVSSKNRITVREITSRT